VTLLLLSVDAQDLILHADATALSGLSFYCSSATEITDVVFQDPVVAITDADANLSSLSFFYSAAAAMAASNLTIS